MKIATFFNLIRWKNLVLLILIQTLIKYYFLVNFGFETILSNYLFFILIFSTVILTASGYIINDIIDLKVDAINKPKKAIVGNKISIINAKKMYLLLTILGLSTGTYLSLIIEKPLYTLYFIGVSALLFLYSKYLKGKILIGNIIVSLLLAFSLIIIIIFDTPLNMNSMQWSLHLKTLFVIIVYAVFAFLLNFIREIIKDIEDIDGDYNEGLKTFPVVFGRKTARNFAIFISILTIYLLIFITSNQIETRTISFAYIVAFVFLPLLYFTIRLWNAKTKKEYSFLSNLLKIIILLGIISIPILSNYLKYAFD